MSCVVRRYLLRLGRESGDPATALCFQAVARLGLGKTSPEVAQELDLARSTVVPAAHRFAKEGLAGLYDKRRTNGKRMADDGFHRRVVQLLRRMPEDFGWRRSTWTRELLCRQMKREDWQDVEVSTMCRVLARMALGSGGPSLSCCAREARLVEIPALEARARARARALSYRKPGVPFTRAKRRAR